MATSRQPLGVGEEQVLPIPPLACPADSGPAAVQKSDAGRLFLDRARAAWPQFRLDEANAAQVAGALGQPQAEPGRADTRTAVPAELAAALQAPACATYMEEGRAGGTSLIITCTRGEQLPVSTSATPARGVQAAWPPGA